ncbi:MAG: neutral/alkaline non-lysosomal ceramidase N-terminal domain-containing protein [Bacteroidota bacterium]
MKKWLLRLLLVLLLIVLGLGVWMYSNLGDNFPGYSIDIDIPAGNAMPLRAGFAKVSISPELPDPWVDVNQDSMYRPEDGDTYEDGNGNGRFDAVWMAGFGKHRAAHGHHDSLWARAMVIDDGHTRMAVVVLDVIGFGHDDVIRVRQLIPEDANLTYTTVASTHTHEGPDLVGLWGPGIFTSGVDPDYQQLVIRRTAQAVMEAVENLRPTILRIGEDMTGAIPYVADTRKPEVLDPGITVLQFLDVETDTTLGSLFAWADHPETLWDKNMQLSSDFPHYVREGMEQGLYQGDSLMQAGLGGVCVYINGAIGGLMTTHPTTPIPDPFVDTIYLEPSFAKIEAQGWQLAKLGLDAIQDSSGQTLREASLQIRAKTIDLPLDNPLFRLAASLKVFDRGMSGWMQMRTEVAFWQLGPVSCLQVPGEIYPEIVNGGIEAPKGQDFRVPPQEIPPLRSQMPGRYKMIFGLANDLIGYIIPRSEWDQEAPFIYGYESDPYGEINSVGPETAGIIHRECLQLLAD